MKIILLGAPGSGKGTQAEVICKKYQIPHISTGNIIRESLESGSVIASEAKKYLDLGQLLPDDIVIKIIKDRLEQKDCTQGYVFDGYPRTIPQAEALDEMGIEIDVVLNLEVADDEIIHRLSGRRTCTNPQCNAVYHLLYNKPQTTDVCDKCASALYQREDDQIDTIKKRLQVYHKQTEPLIEFYKKKGNLVSVQSQGEVKDTTALVIAALEA